MTDSRMLCIGSVDYGKTFHAHGDVDYVWNDVTTHDRHMYEGRLIDGEYDAVLFTGGTDVHPVMYNGPDFGGNHDLQRDHFEARMFEAAQTGNVSCLGICRGSQFLAAMAGYKVIQDMKHHALAGTHMARCTQFVSPVGIQADMQFQVTSTHHQNPDMFSFDRHVTVLLTGHNHKVHSCEAYMVPALSIYAVQYHPEYMGVNTSGWLFWQDLIREALGKRPGLWSFRESLEGEVA